MLPVIDTTLLLTLIQEGERVRIFRGLFHFKRADSSFPAPRITNYMDGRNGAYRYGYETQGAGRGYGPFELSGILAEGWWGFLPGDEIRKVWKDFASRFPLQPEVIAAYTGPNTTSVRHPLVSWPDYFSNGMAETNVKSIVAMS